MADHNEHTAGHHHEHGTVQHDADESGMAELLDLDAEILADQLAEVIDWAGRHTARTPHTIADVGAGTGTGSWALATRFPAAEIVAIDRSPAMLTRLETAARTRGLAERMRVAEADLDVAWPEVGTIDLAWAASSLHHFTDVDRVLRDILAALNPGGLCVAVEMDSFPLVLPTDVGIGRPGLEARLHDAIAQSGWNSYPDWQTNLENAGFDFIEKRVFAVDVTPAPESTGRYAHAFLTRIRSGLTDQLDADDLATLDSLLETDASQGVLRRGDLSLRSSRTAWAARRP